MTAIETSIAPEAGETAGSGILPASHWAQLEARRASEEGQGDEADSAVDDAASSTASLSSSILNYRTLHGRTYHSDQGNAHYWASNDAAQNESLDIIHHVLTLLLENKLHLAPLKKDIKKVLDIGTGTGLWAIDFAEEHPEVSVVGTEISPIQPVWIPPNLQFEIDDCTREWTFAPDSVDYIHIRWLFGCIKDWPALFAQAFKCLKPGGYIESHEASVQFRSDDGTVNDTTAMGQFGKFFVEGGKALGRSMTVVEDGVQRKAIEEAGFVQIQEQDFKNPIGSWPQDPKQKQIGQFQQLAVEQDTEGSILLVADMAGWKKEEVQVYVAHLRRELRSPSIHGYYLQKVVYAQKPESI